MHRALGKLAVVCTEGRAERHKGRQSALYDPQRSKVVGQVAAQVAGHVEGSRAGSSVDHAVVPNKGKVLAGSAVLIVPTKGDVLAGIAAYSQTLNDDTPSFATATSIAYQL